MPFGEHEEELWEAMKPRFRPRLVSDPNARFARNLVKGAGVAAIPAALRAIDRSARATLARVVRRTPEVL